MNPAGRPQTDHNMRTETLTKRQYNALRAKLNAYQSAAEQWMRDNKTNGIPFEVYSKFPFTKYATNENRAKVEVFEFLNCPPEKYLIYVNEKDRTATTWTGAKLGNVSFGNSFRTNFGDVRVPINVRAVNGRSYHGTYFKSAGDYAKITAFK